jgi:hypothetical protein
MNGSIPFAINLGGEGEVPSVLNQQGRWVIVDSSWQSSLSGQSFVELIQDGHSFLICDNAAIPLPTIVPILEYVEDRDAEVDANIVMTGSGRLVEVQGTGEETTFSRDQLNRMLDLAQAGITTIAEKQQAALRNTV